MTNPGVAQTQTEEVQEGKEEGLETITISIKDYLQEALPPQEGRRVILDEATKLLTITDTPSNHALIKRLIKNFDVEPKQVLIEAKLIEITLTDLNELGIEWYWFGHGTPTVGTSTPTKYEGVQWDDSTSTTFPKTSFGANFFISKTTSSDFLRAYLHALEEKGKANLLAAPKVTTLSGQMANIQIVRTIPYVSDVDLENIGTADHPLYKYIYSVNEKPVGIALEVTPYATENSDLITLEVHPEITVLKKQISVYPAFVSADDAGWPVVDTRSAQTTVIVKSGDSIIMGGLIKDDDTKTQRKIPILGDIPVLGNLFKYDYSRREKKNLLLLLTATLVSSEGHVLGY